MMLPVDGFWRWVIGSKLIETENTMEPIYRRSRHGIQRLDDDDAEVLFWSHVGLFMLLIIVL